MPRDASSVTDERDGSGGGEWVVFWALVGMAIVFALAVLFGWYLLYTA